ncbi:phosphoglycolate phosphatase 1 [Thermocladium modestius]|uniref:Phosphoglycolate phosphatase 1 n=1 Tax=Thermocladium modestius TaxID=62609 RepID=A0A830GW99_9CREN|nr:HAD-IA family hydrolase [Thermocladium modestius]GGP20950.1 phosphoglycolate phosphatase 1 [Thermocladium modestius]
MIRCALFDFDDTLVDSNPARECARRAVASELSSLTGIDSKIIDSVILEIEQKMEVSNIFNRNIWWRSVAKAIGVSIGEEQENGLTSLYWSKWIEGSRAFRDAIYALPELDKCGVVLGMIANDDGTPGYKRRRIERSDIPLDLFKLILIAGDDVPQEKPDPAPFSKALSILGMDPKACLYVGDKPYADVPGAKKVGMWTAIVKRGPIGDLLHMADEAKPSFVIGSLNELINILQC